MSRPTSITEAVDVLIAEVERAEAGTGVCSSCGAEGRTFGEQCRECYASTAAHWEERSHMTSDYVLDLLDEQVHTGPAVREEIWRIWLERWRTRSEPIGPVTTVRIPGSLTAHWQEGRIVGWTFMPHGSAAGYFGPTAELVDGDDDLDVTDVDGPFWRAVQRHLDTANPFTVRWEE